MAITRQTKEAIVAKVTEAIGASKTMVFVHFKGLTVAETTALRRKLRSEGVGYTVAKKTLLKRAFMDAGIAGEMPVLDGEIGFAYGADMLAPAREVHEFAKSKKDKVGIVGGVFEGKFMDATSMRDIATIPGRQVLIGQFVNLINSPIQRLAIALDQIAAKKA
jgi:large subunit ribosomal protein L10